jgi:hypothetical protein
LQGIFAGHFAGHLHGICMAFAGHLWGIFAVHVCSAFLHQIQFCIKTSFSVAGSKTHCEKRIKI